VVKMETTEPSVILKLAKGGAVAMKKGGKVDNGYKKMADGGGAMGALMGTPALVGRPAINAPVQVPGKPSMAMRRKAMMAKPAMAAPAMPAGNPGLPAMKKGGKMAKGGMESDAETSSEEKMDTAQDKAMIKKAFKQHDSQEHKGGKGTELKLKKGGKYATGGVTNGNGGGYATGGVANGQGGYATGGVALGNGGGYKMGGKASKKAYAMGGTVNSGRPVAMPQGNKKPSAPVGIDRLSGTFKRGGTVKMSDGGGDLSKGAYDASGKASRDVEDALNPLGMVKELVGKAKNYFMPKNADSVTKTKESVTVTPAGKKRGGGAC